MVNLAAFVASEIRAMMIKDVQLYQSGNMKSNVKVVAVEEDYIDIVIDTNYASYTNTRGRMAGWIERTIDRCCRCYSENNNVESEFMGDYVDVINKF